jgi:hypothetical protein
LSARLVHFFHHANKQGGAFLDAYIMQHALLWRVLRLQQNGSDHTQELPRVAVAKLVARL